MNVIKNRRIYLFISLVVIIIGLGTMAFRGLNYGIDFTGGTIITVNANKFIPAEEVKQITNKLDKNMSVIYSGKDKKDIIIKSTLNISNKDMIAIGDEFKDKHDIESKNINAKIVGPSIGKETRNKAILSTIIASVLMLVYITFRFEFTLGVSAIVALIHDVLVTISIYAIFNLPVNSSFIAAILTIVGYSINDTIVIFDKIRENMRFNSRQKLEEIINNSVNTTLRRTINTTITTLIAVIVLYIMGVEDIKVLALPLILGMISGTYSSIFIAPSLWYDIKSLKTRTAK
ncbi:protein translocase subunit SecF [Tissierella creatinophila]|uniref:Protein-export membrane protein SecF n=1 Tax=Tissierella creatinophila DSM 6911 TaxID=1123403 RepID=A0A1U7M2X3_TISCR|nr:protein translocase subunit SecF [Tissierella creatinophila]OLS01672.1 protein-export membrane protein SecF [Tissierella creatinophila DSM 6911]